MLTAASEWNGQNWRDVHPLQLSEEQFIHWMKLQRADDSRRSIGGSNAARINRVSKYGGPAEVWDFILRLAPDKEFGEKPWQKRGLHLEPYIAQLYSEKFKRDTKPANNPANKFGTWFHPDFDFLTAHPDFLIPDLVSDGVLECKTVFGSVLDEVKGTGALAEHVIQIQHYMFVLNLNWGVIAYFNADRWEPYFVEVARDNALIQTAEERCINFWREHIMKRIRPDELIHSPVPIVVPQTGGEAKIITTVEYMNAVKGLIEAMEMKKLAEVAYEAQRMRMAELMKRDGYDKISVNSHKVGLMQKAGNTYLDEGELYRTYPFIDLDKFRKQGPPSQPYIQCWPSKPKKR